MQYQRSFIPIEIKSTHTFNSTLLKNIRFYKKLVGERCPTGFLIYGGEAEYTIDGFHVMHVHNTGKIHSILQEMKD